MTVFKKGDFLLQVRSFFSPPSLHPRHQVWIRSHHRFFYSRCFSARRQKSQGNMTRTCGAKKILFQLNQLISRNRIKLSSLKHISDSVLCATRTQVPVRFHFFPENRPFLPSISLDLRLDNNGPFHGMKNKKTNR